MKEYKQPSPLSNYNYLMWWNNFNWDLYIKILKAKSL